MDSGSDSSGSHSDAPPPSSSVELCDAKIPTTRMDQLVRHTQANYIRVLNIRNCDLGKSLDSLLALCGALKSSSGLSELDVSSNNLLVDGAKQIAEVLHVNTSITRLNMESNHITAFGANAIAAALKDNGTLTDLDLAGNNIACGYYGRLSPESLEFGPSAIAKALRQNTTLQCTNLLRNQFTKLGAAEIAQVRQNSPIFSVCGLKTPSNRMLLELADQALGVGDAFLISIECSLEHRIVKLDLSGNCDIGASGCQAISDLLPLGASGILALNVSIAQLYENALEHFVDKLKEGKSNIRWINIKDNYTTGPFNTMFSELCQDRGAGEPRIQLIF